MRFLPVLLLFILTFSACEEKRMEEKEIEIEKVIDADAEPGMIHSVYFWLKEDLDEAALREFNDAVMELETIPTVKRMFIGPAAGTEVRGVTDNTFDLALILWFDDIAGHDAYQIHPTHTNFVDTQSGKFATVKVYDNMLK